MDISIVQQDHEHSETRKVPCTCPGGSMSSQIWRATGYKHLLHLGHQDGQCPVAGTDFSLDQFYWPNAIPGKLTGPMLLTHMCHWKSTGQFFYGTLAQATLPRVINNPGLFCPTGYKPLFWGVQIWGNAVLDSWCISIPEPQTSFNVFMMWSVSVSTISY
jgi:hypothetical protein